MRKSLIAALLLVAVSTFANANVFAKYEATRQAFLAGKLKSVQTHAAALAADARKAKQAGIAKRADAVAQSADLDKARVAFAALSDEVIRYRATVKGNKPAIYSCPMINKSWLQPKGKIGNPYDAAMAMCGVLKSE